MSWEPYIRTGTYAIGIPSVLVATYYGFTVNKERIELENKLKEIEKKEKKELQDKLKDLEEKRQLEKKDLEGRWKELEEKRELEKKDLEEKKQLEKRELEERWKIVVNGELRKKELEKNELEVKLEILTDKLKELEKKEQDEIGRKKKKEEDKKEKEERERIEQEERERREQEERERREQAVKTTYDVLFAFGLNEDGMFGVIDIQKGKSFDGNADTIIVATVGNFRRGKTLLVNEIFGFNIPVSAHDSTSGISGVSDKKGTLILDTAGLGAPIRILEGNSLVEKRKRHDELIVEVALSVADIVIVTVNTVSLDEQDLILSIQKKLEATTKVGCDKLFVVHNYLGITEPLELFMTFQKYVLQNFICTPVEVNIKTHGQVLKYTYYKSETLGCRYPIYHFLMGRAGTNAGVQNEKTYDTLRHLIGTTIGRAKKRDVESEVIKILDEIQGKKERKYCTSEQKEKQKGLDSTYYINKLKQQENSKILQAYFNDKNLRTLDEAITTMIEQKK